MVQSAAGCDNNELKIVQALRRLGPLPRGGPGYPIGRADVDMLDTSTLVQATRQTAPPIAASATRPYAYEPDAMSAF
eukprot:16430054-Heterocapsa_arctica.AAC.1